VTVIISLMQSPLVSLKQKAQLCLVYLVADHGIFLINLSILLEA